MLKRIGEGTKEGWMDRELRGNAHVVLQRIDEGRMDSWKEYEGGREG